MQLLNYEQIIEEILNSEGIKPGEKINLERLTEIASRHGIDRKELAVNIFKVDSSEYSQLIRKNSSRRNIIVLREQGLDNHLKEVAQLRKRILDEEGIKPGDRISLLRLREMADKYNMDEKKLAREIFKVTSTEYSHLTNANSNVKNVVVLRSEKVKKTPEEIESLCETILVQEKLKPGDKIDLERLTKIASKYDLDRKELATKFFKVSVSKYSYLISKTDKRKTITILSERIKVRTQDEIKQLRETILKQESLKPGDRISLEKVDEIANKYGIDRKELIITIFLASDSQYYSLINPNSRNIRLKILKKQNLPDQKVEKLREDILLQENLRPGDKINLEKLTEIASKYNIDKKELAIQIFKVKSSEYSRLINPNSKLKNIVILRNEIESKTAEEIKQLRQTILDQENLKPGDKLSLEGLTKIANKYGINARDLVVKVFEIDSVVYYQLLSEKSVRKNMVIPGTRIPQDTKQKSRRTQTEIMQLRERIWNEKNLKEGMKITKVDIETIMKEYNLSKKELFYVLGITSSIYNYLVKTSKHESKTTIRDFHIKSIVEVIYTVIEKNRYYTKQEIETICKSNNITVKNFFDYAISMYTTHSIRYMRHNNYQEVLDKKGRIWLGDKCELSNEFVEREVLTIQQIARNAVINVSNSYPKLYSNFDKDDLEQDACIYILTKCGDLEKNFEGNELEKMIFLRTRKFLLKYLSTRTEIQTTKSVKFYMKNTGSYEKIDIEAQDENENIEKKAIDNLTKSSFEKNDVIQFLGSLFNDGYERKEALNITMKRFNLSQENLLEIMQQELIRKGKVKKTKEGQFILGES